MNKELTKDAQRIADAAQQYAKEYGIDSVDVERLYRAFIKGASFTVGVMRDIHAEITGTYKAAIERARHK